MEIFSLVASVGRFSLNVLTSVGSIFLFASKALMGVFVLPFYLTSVLRNILNIG